MLRTLFHLGLSTNGESAVKYFIEMFISRFLEESFQLNIQ